MNRFVAVDGESFTTSTDHRYVLLAASTEDYVFDSKGLSTVRCLEFLLSLPKRTIKVAFGWNYDVNMILRDLPAGDLIRLWKDGSTRWNTYSLEWIPSKWFVIRCGTRYVKICEAFGFFQTSFVNSLRKWGIEPTAEVESMKQVRATFDKKMKNEVIEYCLTECNQLVELMDELEIALEAVGLRLSSWIGAGSIASALMRREGVKKHLRSDSDFGHEPYAAIRHGYFGGRSELYLQGEFPTLYDYDISSAYPFVATELPSLAGGKFVHRSQYDSRYEYALWKVSWSVPSDSIIMPFPLRASANRGDIYYPSNGAGWYHASEVKAARAIYGGRINVDGGYSFHPSSDHKPFDFIPRIYDHRAELKRQNHAGEKVLKLGLNSIYGKLAQGFGYKDKRPPFQSYFLAGAITAGCRARILTLAAMNVENLVMVATDGIFFRTPLDIPLEPGLGGLELTIMDDVFVAQPGVYSAVVDGETYGRSRGFFSKEIDFGDIRRGFAECGPTYVGSYESTRFVGIGSALILRSLDKWRSWHTSKRTLSLYPSRKFVHDMNSTPIRHHPPSMPKDIFSERYTPKNRGAPLTGDDFDALVSYLQGIEQPLRNY